MGASDQPNKGKPRERGQAKDKSPVESSTPTSPFQAIWAVLWASKWRWFIVIPLATLAAAFSVWSSLPDSTKEWFLGSKRPVQKIPVISHKADRALDPNAIGSENSERLQPRVNFVFRIKMSSGKSVVIEWYGGMPVEISGEEVLRGRGVSLNEVDLGTKLAYAALAKLPPEAIGYRPLLVGNRLAFGYSHAVSAPEPGPRASYQGFELEQDKERFTISMRVERTTQEPIRPSDIGIDWGQVQIGLTRALVALNNGTISVRFGQVSGFANPGGSWGYQLPYEISAK